MSLIVARRRGKGRCQAGAVVAGALLALLCSPALSQVTDDQRRALYQDTPEELRHVFRGSRLNVEAAALQLFSQASAGRDLITSEMVDSFSRLAMARFRAAAAADAARYDADGDGFATAAEVTRGASDAYDSQPRQGLSDERRQQAIAQMSAQVMRMDADGDGRVSLRESYAYAQRQAASDRSGAMLSKLHGLRSAGSSSISRLEFMSYVERRFAAFDADSDGVLSGPEIASLANAPGAFGSQPGLGVIVDRRAACDAPAPSQAAKVALVLGYEGAAMSTVYVGSPDEETQVVDVAIEPGEGPVYVLASSYRQVVWRLSGYVERVERFVATRSHAVAGPVAAGVVGLRPEKVSFATPGSCFRGGSGSDSVEGVIARGDVARSLGRPVDVVAGSYTMASLSLPSGKSGAKAADVVVPPHLKVAPGILGHHYVERGMIAIDPGSVVSKAKVASYDVMPQGYGLSKLVSEGRVIAMGNGRDYKVVAPIPRFPAGLNGGHSVRFVIARGVPLPAGDPGHSCVVMEETGEANRMCNIGR